MATNDIKSMNDTITSINTKMASSKKGIIINRYEKAVSRLIAAMKSNQSNISRVEKKLDDISDRLKKLEHSGSSKIDASKFLSSEYRQTIEDMTANINDMWNIIDRFDSNNETSEVLDELLKE